MAGINASLAVKILVIIWKCWMQRPILLLPFCETVYGVKGLGHSAKHRSARVEYCAQSIQNGNIWCYHCRCGCRNWNGCWRKNSYSFLNRKTVWCSRSLRRWIPEIRSRNQRSKGAIVKNKVPLKDSGNKAQQVRHLFIVAITSGSLLLSFQYVSAIWDSTIAELGKKVNAQVSIPKGL